MIIRSKIGLRNSIVPAVADFIAELIGDKITLPGFENDVYLMKIPGD